VSVLLKCALVIFASAFADIDRISQANPFRIFCVPRIFSRLYFLQSGFRGKRGKRKSFIFRIILLTNKGSYAFNHNYLPE
jgi:hypothetical protein